MTLDNLLGSTLESIAPDKITIQKLLDSAAASLKDASIESISNQSRFDVAYKAIMQLANASLQANGYRTLTSRPGHHQTMLQALPKTIGIDSARVAEFDAMRKTRNVIDYSGDLVTDKQRDACIQLAANLHTSVTKWLRENHPDLLED